MSNANSQRDEVYADKVHNTKEQSIIISAFKKYVPLILGGLVKEKE